MSAAPKRLSQINLNTLRIAEAAARHANFTRAAEENFITPSAVSQQIRKLEEQLEFRIFQRRNNAVSLTPEGQEFIMAVRDALDRIILSRNDVVRRREQDTLKISVLPTFAVRWLLPRLSAYQKAHRDTQIFVSNSYKCVDFRAEDFDCAVRFGQGQWPGLHAEPLFFEELMPVCQPALWNACFPNVAETDDLRLLRHFPLLQSETCVAYWDEYLRVLSGDTILQEASRIRFDSCLLAVEAAACGMGFAIMNKVYVERDLESGRLIAPFRQTLHRDDGWFFVCPERTKDQPNVRSFAEWLHAQAAAYGSPAPQAAAE